MHNAERSVERIAGVKTVKVDLNTGRADVWFEPGQSIEPVELWKAVFRSGFTPVRIEWKDQVYQGAKQHLKVVGEGREYAIQSEE